MIICSTYLCNFAEGAFGAVDKRKLVNADGSVSYYAIKRLKKQDVNMEVCRYSDNVVTCFRSDYLRLNLA
jgi:hypothetical protein